MKRSTLKSEIADRYPHCSLTKYLLCVISYKKMLELFIIGDAGYIKAYKVELVCKYSIYHGKHLV